jgi:hypothetical protein
MSQLSRCWTGTSHRLDMQLDLQSLFWLHVHSRTHWLRPRNPSLPPAFGLIYEGAIGQLRKNRHFLVTPWIRIRDPVTFCPLDPGWVKRQDPDTG